MRVRQVGGQVGKDRRACPARGKLNGEVAGHADILATILARKSARMSVSVAVSLSVPGNSILINNDITELINFDSCYAFTFATITNIKQNTRTAQSLYVFKHLINSCDFTAYT